MEGACMDKPWFMYEIVVPFGNPNFDFLYGGAHDLDIGTPPDYAAFANYPVTALLPGIILSITDGKDAAGNAIWGRQVGIRLAHPYNGVPNMAYLHLSAVEPKLKVNHPVAKGDLIGWVGGGTDPHDYDRRSNPTGQNFLNTPSRSSQIQVGVALMRGNEYGNEQFNKWPPIEWDLNPTQIILDARKDFLKGGPEVFSNDLCVVVFNSYFVSIGKTPPPRDTGIFNDWRSQWINGNYKGCCLSAEYPVTLPNGDPGVAQNFADGTCVWNKKTNTATWL
jgi:hypothetical protein